MDSGGSKEYNSLTSSCRRGDITGGGAGGGDPEARAGCRIGSLRFVFPAKSDSRESEEAVSEQDDGGTPLSQRHCGLVARFLPFWHH